MVQLVVLFGASTVVSLVMHTLTLFFEKMISANSGMHPLSCNIGFMNILMSYYKVIGKTNCPKSSPNPDTKITLLLTVTQASSCFC